MTFPTRTPMTDTQRVLGQIERGEVRADAQAAREIAARDEEKYGSAFRGTPAEALLAQLQTARRFATNTTKDCQ